MWLMSKGGPDSQAGRRGFESLLPLHFFNNLREIGLLQKPTFRGNWVHGRAEPFERNWLEGLTSSVSGQSTDSAPGAADRAMPELEMDIVKLIAD